MPSTEVMLCCSYAQTNMLLVTCKGEISSSCPKLQSCFSLFKSSLLRHFHLHASSCSFLSFYCAVHLQPKSPRRSLQEQSEEKEQQSPHRRQPCSVNNPALSLVSVLRPVTWLLVGAQVDNHGDGLLVAKTHSDAMANVLFLENETIQPPKE